MTLIHRWAFVCPACGHPSLRLLKVELCWKDDHPHDYICSTCQQQFRYQPYHWFRMIQDGSSSASPRRSKQQLEAFEPVTWRWTSMLPKELERMLREQCSAYLSEQWRRTKAVEGPEYDLDPHAHALMGIIMREVRERPSAQKPDATFLYALIGHGLCLLQAWDASLIEKEHPSKTECEQMADHILRFYLAQLCPEFVVTERKYNGKGTHLP